MRHRREYLVVELEVDSQCFTGSAGTIVLVQIDLFVLRILLGHGPPQALRTSRGGRKDEWDSQPTECTDEGDDTKQLRERKAIGSRAGRRQIVAHENFSFQPRGAKKQLTFQAAPPISDASPRPVSPS